MIEIDEKTIAECSSLLEQLTKRCREWRIAYITVVVVCVAALVVCGLLTGRRIADMQRKLDACVAAQKETIP